MEMEKEVQERFERIESILERSLTQQSDFNQALRVAHIEVETAQVNTNKTIDRLSAKVEDLAEELANLKILVDQLVKRDMDR